MAKKNPPTEQIRVNPALAKKLRLLAEFFDFKTPGDYLQDRLAAIVAKDLAAMANALPKNGKLKE